MHVGQLSLNQATMATTPTEQVLALCEETGVTQVSLWRDQYVLGDVTRTARLVRAHGLTVSSLCRGGFFTGTRSPDEAEEDNRRAIDEAAALEAPVVVLVCGPVLRDGLAAAEKGIVDGIVKLAPYAQQAAVSLAIEPFHPMLAAQRSAVVTLDQACDLVDRIAHPSVGIALDTYHVWWDPNLPQALQRALPAISTVHIADWLVPTTDLLSGRGLPGEGIADLTGILSAVDRHGYHGPLEVEVLNPTVWARPADQLLADIQRRMLTLLTALPSGPVEVGLS